MGKTKAIILGVISALPLLYLCFFLLVVTSFTNYDFDMTNLIFILHPLDILLTIGLLIYYVPHSLNNKDVPKSQRSLWPFLLIIGNAFMIPVYFYTFIWKKIK